MSVLYHKTGKNMQNEESNPVKLANDFKDNPELESLPPDQREEYLVELMKNPSVRTKELVREAERLLAEGDLDGTERFIKKAEESYNSAGLDNEEIVGKLKKLKEIFEEEQSKVIKIAKGTREEINKTL